MFMLKSTHEAEMKPLREKLFDSEQQRIHFQGAATDWEAKFKKAVADLAAASDEIADYRQQIARADHMMDQATEWLENQTERAEYWLSQAEGYRPDAQKWRDSLKRSRDRKEAKKHIAKPLAGATPPARDKRAKRGGGK